MASLVNRLAPLASLLLAGGLAAACSDTETLGSPGGAAGAAQAGTTQAGGSSQAGAGQGGEAGTAGTAGAGGTAGAPTVKRIVEQRSVLGHALPGNLFFDGDFELTRSGSAQASWLVVNKSGNLADLALETGGACQSGLLCAKLASKQQAVALGAAATGSMEATFKVKPLDANASCQKVNASLVSCLSLYETITNSFSADFTLGATDEQGWCTFEASLDAQNEGVCLVIQNDSSGVLLIDDATLVGVATKKQTTTPKPATPAQLATIEQLRPAMRQHRQRTPLPQLARPRVDLRR